MFDASRLGRSVTTSAADFEALAETVGEVLAAEQGVVAAYLYGSVARGDATRLSDVDVAVLPAETVVASERGTLLRRLVTLLERRHPGQRFEVRCFDELPVALRGRVVTEGRRLVDRVPSLRVQAEVKVRMEYHDFLAFERCGVREGLAGLREKFTPRSTS